MSVFLVSLHLWHENIKMLNISSLSLLTVFSILSPNLSIPLISSSPSVYHYPHSTDKSSYETSQYDEKKFYYKESKAKFLDIDSHGDVGLAFSLKFKTENKSNGLVIDFPSKKNKGSRQRNASRLDGVVLVRVGIRLVQD